MRRARPSRSSNGVSRSNPSRVGERLDHPGEQRGCVEVGPDGDRPLAEAQPAVGDEHRRVGAVLDAQPLADRAPAQRAVEREVVGRQLVEAAAATRRRRGAGCSGRRASSTRLASSPTRAMCTTPLPRSSADSIESASRDRVARRTTARSTTTSILCLRRWLSLGGLSRLTDWPSTRTRAKPEARSSSQSAS